MKKFILAFSLLFLLLGASVAIASVNSKNVILKDSAGTAMTAYTFSTAKTTERVPVANNTGYMTLLIDVTSGTIDKITHEYSIDGTNWYFPYITDGTTATSSDTVTTADFTEDRWIRISPFLGNYVRFTITPSGSTVISASLIYQTSQ